MLIALLNIVCFPGLDSEEHGPGMRRPPVWLALCPAVPGKVEPSDERRTASSAPGAPAAGAPAYPGGGAAAQQRGADEAGEASIRRDPRYSALHRDAVRGDPGRGYPPDAVVRHLSR